MDEVPCKMSMKMDQFCMSDTLKVVIDRTSNEQYFDHLVFSNRTIVDLFLNVLRILYSVSLLTMFWIGAFWGRNGLMDFRVTEQCQGKWCFQKSKIYQNN